MIGGVQEKQPAGLVRGVLDVNLGIISLIKPAGSSRLEPTVRSRRGQGPSLDPHRLSKGLKMLPLAALIPFFFDGLNSALLFVPFLSHLNLQLQPNLRLLPSYADFLSSSSKLLASLLSFSPPPSLPDIAFTPLRSIPALVILP